MIADEEEKNTQIYRKQTMSMIRPTQKPTDNCGMRSLATFEENTHTYPFREGKKKGNTHTQINALSQANTRKIRPMNGLG